MLTSSLGVLLSVAVAVVSQQTGNHPEWSRWCGKVYESGFPSYDPGGQTREPPIIEGGPNLHVQFKPRYSIYLSSESKGEFVVNAEVSSWFGQPWPNLTSLATSPKLWFSINLVSSDDILVENSVSLNSMGNVFAFDLTRLKPSFQPYEVVLFGAAEAGEPNITATSQLWYLPEKTNGSVTKLDNLNGGLWFRNPVTNGSFVPLLPYGFYSSGDDSFLSASDNIQKVQAYQDLGLNGIIPLTPIFKNQPVFEYMDKIDLKFMYDLRDYYKNLTAVQEQVSAIKDYDALFSYWGADEPDGWQDPFNGTVLSHDLIRSIDPYHPVSVTLNCQDYYFKEYTAGADFIMEDVYPIGINSTWSKWGTACNTTLGDCGCDNCQGNVQDVARRLDDLARYERWSGLWPKTKAHNPQSFHGEDYWMRDPTVDEEVAMVALALNHDAKASFSWVYPASSDLSAIHGEFARVVTRSPAVEFVVGSKPSAIRVAGLGVLDVAYWSRGSKALVSVVNGGYVDIDGPVRISFPDPSRPSAVSQSLWGPSAWQLLGSELVFEGKLPAMSVSLLLLDL